MGGFRRIDDGDDLDCTGYVEGDGHGHRIGLAGVSCVCCMRFCWSGERGAGPGSALGMELQ